MKSTIFLTKKDIGVLFVCVMFLVMNLGWAGVRSRYHAKMLACRANLGAMSRASIAFATDNDGRFFGYAYSLWIDEVADYTNYMDRIRYCPGTEMMDNEYSYWGSSTEMWCWSTGLVEPEHGSYGFNGWLYNYLESAVYWGFVGIYEVENMAWHNIVRIPDTAVVPFFFDGAWVDAWPKDTDTVPVSFSLDYGGHGLDWPVNQHMQRLLLNRHLGQCNLGFVDGHAESVELGRLWGLKWHREFEIFDGVMTRVDDSPIYP